MPLLLRCNIALHHARRPHRPTCQNFKEIMELVFFALLGTSLLLATIIIKGEF